MFLPRFRSLGWPWASVSCTRKCAYIRHTPRPVSVTGAGRRVLEEFRVPQTTKRATQQDPHPPDRKPSPGAAATPARRPPMSLRNSTTPRAGLYITLGQTGRFPIRNPAHDHDQRSLWARRPHRHQPRNTKTCSSRVSGIRPPTVSPLPRAETEEYRVDRDPTLHLIASRGAAIVPLLSVANRSKRHSRGPCKSAFPAPPGPYPRRGDCLNDERSRRCSGGRAAV
jgi:hypothetical protein